MEFLHDFTTLESNVVHVQSASKYFTHNQYTSQMNSLRRSNAVIKSKAKSNGASHNIDCNKWISKVFRPVYWIVEDVSKKQLAAIQ